MSRIFLGIIRILFSVVCENFRVYKSILAPFLPGATDEEIHKIEELIERIMDNMSVEMRHFNAKYYKIGFCDGLRLVIECLNNN